MKFYTTPYHHNLLKDDERLSVFNEAIVDYYKRNINLDNGKGNFKKLEKTVFDIGCGTGVLSFFASKYFHRIIAIDKDVKILNYAKKSFEKNKNFNNITFYLEDALSCSFNEKADLIICEMLDTALIEEEEILVLNKLHKYLKNNGEIIPKGFINIVEPVFMEGTNIQYDNYLKTLNHQILGNFVKYSEFDFSKWIKQDFETTVEFEIAKDSRLNGIKITSFTKLNQNFICGPTPMMNSPLLIPIDDKNVVKGEKIKISLKYLMGGGLQTIKTAIIK